MFRLVCLLLTVTAEQDGREAGGDRYGQDDADAARQALHDDDVEAVGVQQLQERQVVDVVEHRAEAREEDAGEVEKSEGVRHSVLDDAVALIDWRARLSVVGDDAELIFRDVDDGVGRSPVLAARSDVILLLRDQVIEL